MHKITVKRQLLNESMGFVEQRHARGFVHTAALHPHQPVFHDVRPAHPVAATDLVEFQHQLVRCQPLTVHGHRHPRLKADRDRLGLVGSLLGSDGHPEIDHRKAVGGEVFKTARLIAGVQAVFIRRIGLLVGSLHGNLLGITEIKHLCATRKPLAELSHSPGCKDLDRRINRFRSQLKATLIVALPGRTVGKDSRPLTVSDLHTDAADQRPGDRCAEEIRAFVAGLPGERGEGEVATEFFASINDHRLLRATRRGFRQDRFTIFARLPEVDIHRDHVVALLDQPAEKHGGIEST